MFSGPLEDLQRFITAITGNQASHRNATRRGAEEAGRGLDARVAIQTMAGAGARAARGLRGRHAPTPPVLVVSFSGMGGTSSLFAAGGEDALMMPLGPLSMGLGFGLEDVDSAITGNAMRAMMEHVLQAVVQRSMEEQRTPAVPPATETSRDALPRVVVTKEDLLDSTNSKCSVCLEEFRAGVHATRMLCGHLFCTGCIREWLRSANTCPVCRFELATDNQEYEAGRMTRMQGRMARLKEGELRVMRIPDLRRLMAALGVSGEGCVEKADLIKRLSTAPGVELAPDRKDIYYEEGDLRSLELPSLRSLLERHCVPLPMEEVEEEEEEHAEAIRRFAAAGLIDMKAASGLLNMKAVPVRVKPLTAAGLTIAGPKSSSTEAVEGQIHPIRLSSAEASSSSPSSKDLCVAVANETSLDDGAAGNSTSAASASRSTSSASVSRPPRRTSSTRSRRNSSNQLARAAEQSADAASSEAGTLRSSSRNAGGPLRPQRPVDAPPVVTRPRPGAPGRRVRASDGTQG